MNAEQIVPLIHATATKAVLYITGGGTEVLPMLLERGGGSATLLSARVPYANTETVELLGGTPDKFVSEATTRQLAMAAFQKALALRTGNEPVIGVACSSALQKTPEEREGRIHYIFAALQTNEKTVSVRLEINPKTMDWQWYGQPVHPAAIDIRKWEEKLNSLVMLNLIAEGCGLTERVDVILHGCNPSRHESTLVSSYLAGLLEGTVSRLAFEVEDGKIVRLSTAEHAFCNWKDAPYSSFILPGSFNSAHPGHFEMADYISVLADWENCPVDFEISIRNVDKPMLDFISIEERLLSIAKGGNRKVWLTNAPTFVEKVGVFSTPFTKFLIGYDTAVRICNPKYAGDVDKVIDVFYKHNTRFVVFGREIDGVYHPGFGYDVAESEAHPEKIVGVYHEPDTDEIPGRFTVCCIAITEQLPFRAVSSTGIRRQSN